MTVLRLRSVHGPPSRWPRILAGVVALGVGIGTVAAAFLPAVSGVLGFLAPDSASATALDHVLVAAIGVGVLLVARGLVRGSRRAADVAVVLLVATAAADTLNGGPIARILAELGVAGLLLVRRSSFALGGGRPTAALAGGVAFGAAGVAYALAVVGFIGRDEVTSLVPALGAAWSWLISGGWWLQSGTLIAVVLDGLVFLAVIAGTIALYSSLRPAMARVGHEPGEHDRAVAMLDRLADDSLDPFALREDKAFHFTDDGFLAYRVVGATAVVSGDPIGAPGRAPAILAGFEAAAARRGWDVVLTAASEREVGGYRAAGFHVLRIGDEAVVDPREFSLEGKARKTVRKAVHRVERHGWTISCVRGDALEPDTIAELERVEEAWRAGHPRLQGFAMTLGRLWGAPEDGESLYVLGRDEVGSLSAFLRFARYPGGLSLDVMRRLSNEPNGVNEALIVAALAWAKEFGIDEVSLNFAGFSHVMAPRGALTRGERVLRRALELDRGRFQLDRLARFNEKFGPTWRPRYLVHRGLLNLPRAGLRVLQAEAYVRAPRAHALANRWHPAERPAHLDPVTRT
jgi:lysyl-tRNA synthetase class 2